MDFWGTLIHKLQTEIMKKIFKILYAVSRIFFRVTNIRLTSDTYIMGDNFRAIADHIFDEKTRCSAKDIKKKDVVFINTDLIDKWFTESHPFIKDKYIIITHNSDRVIGKKELGYIDEKIIMWYAQNNIVQHERVHPIPIGIENKRLFGPGFILEKYIKRNRKEIEKKNRIIYGFSLQTNPKERTVALDSLKSNRFADPVGNINSQEEYLNALDCYKFVASPIGNGPDCHRTWEAIYLNTVPIVSDDCFIRAFTKIGIPIKSIQGWDDLNGITETELNKEYDDIMCQKNSEALYFNYWKKLILNTKQ